MLEVKADMKHPDATSFVIQGLRNNATIKLYLAGCDNEMVKAVTGHSGGQMLKKQEGMIRQLNTGTRGQESDGTEPARNRNVSTGVSRHARKDERRGPSA